MIKAGYWQAMNARQKRLYITNKVMYGRETRFFELREWRKHGTSKSNANK